MIEKKRTGWKKRESGASMVSARSGEGKFSYSGRRFRGGKKALPVKELGADEYQVLLERSLVNIQLPVVTAPGNDFHSIDTSGGQVEVTSSDETPNETTRLAIAECDMLFNVMQSFRR